MYGKIEIGIAICGMLVLFVMPLVDSVYTAAVGHGLPAILLRALVCALCLIAADLPDGRVPAGGVALDQGLAARASRGWECCTARTRWAR